MNDWSEVHLRLKEWAEWFSANPFGLGYHSTSLEYHLWKGGIDFDHFIQPEVKRHPQAEETETFFQQLKEKIPILAAIIKEHYFYPASVEKHARKLKLSPEAYRRYLDMGRTYIAASLRAKART